MRNQIIQHNKFCLNKYLCIENQVQEEETMRKVFNLMRCDEFYQITIDVFLNVKVRCIF